MASVYLADIPTRHASNFSLRVALYLFRRNGQEYSAFNQNSAQLLCTTSGLSIHPTPSLAPTSTWKERRVPVIPPEKSGLVISSYRETRLLEGSIRAFKSSQSYHMFLNHISLILKKKIFSSLLILIKRKYLSLSYPPLCY